MHHSDQQIPKELSDNLKEQLGATGEFPNGQYHPTDEGEIKMAIVTDRDRELVFLNHGKPVTWIGMTPQQAVELAQSLIQHARSISKEPLRVQLF